MLQFVFYTTILCVLMGTIVKTDSLDELKQSYTNILMECAKKYSITPADIVQLQDKIMPKNNNARCMFACAYKATGMMDDQGMLSVDGVKKMSEKYFADKPETLSNASQFVDACKSVNDQTVTDGDAGCDRAELIFNCTVEKAPLFNIS